MNFTFSVDIPLYFHGVITLMDEIYDSDFGTSASCNVNVACEQGIEWDCQISSVCKIIIGESSCSGSLINNDCCDLTPYILTANHCFTISGVDPIDWNFRFNYESPVCDPSEEPNPLQWVTYFGATIDARWGDTDFLLVELNDALNQEDNLSFSGWDRTTTPNHGVVTCIHHPAGDVKKISIDNTPPATQAFDWFVDDWDIGTTEGGSSGASLFGINQRIMGIDSRGDGLEPCDPNKGTFFGRFDVSWGGNGTPNSRLIDWLGASTNPNTMDCMQHPFIEGPEVLCTDPETYTLINNMPCAKTVTWRVEPANLFASPSSGNGVTASLWGNNTSSGPATLIYTLSAEGCNDAEVGYDLFVGRPCTFELHSFPTEICVGEQGETLSGAAKFKADVFPNPANEFIEVICSGYIPGTRIAASLISTDGKVVKTIEEYSHNFKVDMADLPSGLYVLQLNTDGVIYHEKIVKL